MARLPCPARYAEAVAHHGEAYSQTERHFSQQYSVEEGQYWVAEKAYRRTYQLGKRQHSVNVAIAIRALVREHLRDEFSQKNDRFNALMVVQTVPGLATIHHDPPRQSSSTPGRCWPALTLTYAATCTAAQHLV